MHFYQMIAHRTGSPDARELAARLSAWHDAMVQHERRMKTTGQAPAACAQRDDGCPHAEADELWRDAQQVFGEHARELVFLRARAAVEVDAAVATGADAAAAS